MLAIENAAMSGYRTAVLVPGSIANTLVQMGSISHKAHQLHVSGVARSAVFTYDAVRRACAVEGHKSTTNESRQYGELILQLAVQGNAGARNFQKERRLYSAPALAQLDDSAPQPHTARQQGPSARQR
jgi:hypothetical protein